MPQRSLLVCCVALVQACALTQSLCGQTIIQCNEDGVYITDGFDPYAPPATTDPLASFMPSNSDKTLSETLFTPYYDVLGNRRQLPLASSLALDRGYLLPLPFGVSANFTYLEVNPRVTDVRVGLAGGTPQALPITVNNLQNETQNYLVRLDGWLFPFLNVYGLFGQTSLTSGGDLFIPNPLPLQPDIQVPVVVHAQGPLYGAGAVLAAGYQSWFITLDVNRTRADLDLFDSTIDKTSVGLRTGWRTEGRPRNWALWLGTMYVDNRTYIEGTAISGTSIDPIRYQVETVFDKPWNFLIGSLLELSPSFSLLLEIGFGDREQLTAAASYRF